MGRQRFAQKLIFSAFAAAAVFFGCEISDLGSGRSFGTDQENAEAWTPPQDEILVAWVPAFPESRVIQGKILENQCAAEALCAYGADSREVDKVIRALRAHFDFRRSRPGHKYTLELGPKGEVKRFEYQPSPEKKFVAFHQKTDETSFGPALAPALLDEYVTEVVEFPLERKVVEVRGHVENSLYQALLDAGHSPNLTMVLSDVFQYDIDFFHDTRKGDEFVMHVEEFSHEGEVVRFGKVLAAEYRGASTGAIGTRQLFWFEDEKTKTAGYYDAKGTAAQRAFLRSPLKYSRVSSGYGHRNHPIHGHGHFHAGVDYAAPTGTPVQSVADGTVIFAAYQGASGKLVKIRHIGGYESLYLHLSAIHVRPGQHVSQNTTIGRVGSTGSATGPHLDFRLKLNGSFINPTKQVAPRAHSIAEALKPKFLESIAPWQAILKSAPGEV